MFEDRGLGCQTFLNGGNVIFKSSLPEGELEKALERELAEKTGKEIGVVIRTTGDLERVLTSNPFPEAILL